MTDFTNAMLVLLTRRTQAQSPEEKEAIEREIKALIKEALPPQPEPFDHKKAQAHDDDDY